MNTQKYTARKIVFILISLLWVMPIVFSVLNSFKRSGEISTDMFSVPAGDSFVGFENYNTALTFGNYPFAQAFLYTVLISVVSTLLIIICCSMAAWYIVRVNNLFTKIFYGACLFSLAVPFQMVMFPGYALYDTVCLSGIRCGNGHIPVHGIHQVTAL